MIKHKWVGVVTALLMAAAVLATVFVYFTPSSVAVFAGTASPKYTTAMDKTKIMNIQIIADEAEWANMLEHATEEEYIPATVIIDGIKLENVGIRPKGNSSLSMVARDSTTDRYSFKLEFDQYISGQTWLGLDKLVINNMQGDASYMKEYLSYDIMDYAGVEAPMYAFSEITVNGQAWGFYLAVEALDDSYAKRVYGNGHGKLYKPESMGMRGAGRMNEFIENMENPDAQGTEQQIERQTSEEPANRESGNRQFGNRPPDSEQRSNQPPENAGNNRGGFAGGFGGGMSGNGVSLQYTDNETSSYSAIFENAVFKSNENDYNRVMGALEKLSNGEDLENVVDVEAALKYFAAHTVVVNLDSYVSNMGHNYYLYEDGGQLTILPWDYNLSFGGFQSGGAASVVNFPIDTPVSGVSLTDRPLLGKLLETPEYLELYHGYLRQIVDGYFKSGLFEQTVDSLDALISPYVESDPSAFYDYDAYKAAVPQLKTLGLLRAQSIDGQLNGSIPSTSDGQKAEPDKLIDASVINLSALGSQGMGGGNRDGGEGFGGGRQGQGGGMPNGMDMDTMRQAMEIMQSAGSGDLSEEQLTQLRAMGLTDEQITAIKSVGQNGFGGRRTQGMGGMQNSMGPGGNFPQAQQNPESNERPSSAASGYDTSTWIFLGVCLFLLLCGAWFAFSFKRRRG